MPEIFRGLPNSVIKEQEFPLESLQDIYGNLSTSVLRMVIDIDQKAPRDILTSGDNWIQLVNIFDTPRNSTEAMMADIEPGIIFGNKWPIMHRIAEQDLLHWWSALLTGVKAGSLEPRIVAKIAALDFSDQHSLVTRQDLMQVKDTPWGYNGILMGTSSTEVYVIKRSFAERVIDSVETLDENTSATWYKQQPEFKVSDE